MNIKKFLWAVLIALCAIQAVAQTADDDARVRQRVQAAVIKVYDEALEKKPGDYDTRFARANQLYYNGDLPAAIADAKLVLEQAPAKEKELLHDTYLLLARCYDLQQDYDNEIEALSQAATINPKSMACVDMLGKVSYKVGDLDAAEKNFQTILRDSPMNYDALYWLAQVEVKRNNYGKATDYADRAVSLFTANPQVYINRADVLTQIQQYVPAAQDLISAMSVGSDDNNEAITQLVDMSDNHYDAVMEALASSIDKAPQVGMFQYVRAIIALRQLHYGQALKNFKNIINYNLYDYHSIYYYTALCQFNLMQYDEALSNVNKAIAMQGNEPDYYILKSLIEQYQGKGNNYSQALATLDKAAGLNAKYTPTLLARARMMVNARNNQGALEQLNALLAIEPANAEALLLRGWVYKYRLSKPSAARSDFEQMLTADETMTNLRGFALHELGRADNARQWAQKIIADNKIIGGESYYYAAALLSDIGDAKKGDKDQAIEYLRSALANGYGSLHSLKADETPYVNLKLVRRYPTFETLMKENALNFEERR
ncbi:MAG: tetratricopeptide repeat protein [Muribaculaceae bacterium]|nr:tetratricopeptide repeat protein [Muribaculaceae bacterium]